MQAVPDGRRGLGADGQSKVDRRVSFSLQTRSFTVQCSLDQNLPVDHFFAGVGNQDMSNTATCTFLSGINRVCGELCKLFSRNKIIYCQFHSFRSSRCTSVFSQRLTLGAESAYKIHQFVDSFHFRFMLLTSGNLKCVKAIGLVFVNEIDQFVTSLSRMKHSHAFLCMRSFNNIQRQFNLFTAAQPNPVCFFKIFFSYTNTFSTFQLDRTIALHKQPTVRFEDMPPILLKADHRVPEDSHVRTVNLLRYQWTKQFYSTSPK